VEQIQSALNLAFSFDAIKTQANELVQRYQALEIDTKEELKTAFPMVATIIESMQKIYKNSIKNKKYL
jgi:tRNA A37 threonylcarbamoyltransferase TsaD